DLARACTPDDAGSTTGDGGSGSSESGESSSTTIAPDLGPPADRNPSDFACGNGVLEVGELCDDGNLVDGDGCDADCFASGGVLWTQIYDLGNSGDDFAEAVALLPGGDVV